MWKTKLLKFSKHFCGIWTTNTVILPMSRNPNLKKKKLRNNIFLKIRFYFISIQNSFKIWKKIEFCGYFTHGLVPQRKIKMWSLLALGRVYLKWWSSVQRRQSFGSTLLFFFVEPIHGEVPTELNFFFKFWKNFILIWNKSVFKKKFILKLFYYKNWLKF